MSIFDTSAALAASRAEAFQSANGRTHIWRPARTLLVTQVEGVLSIEAGRIMASFVHRVVAEDGAHVSFHDWEHMTDYDTETRVRLTAAVRSVFKATQGVHILVQSKVVAFGVQAANLMLGNIRSFTSRSEFEAALLECLRKTRELPPTAPPR